MSRLRAWPRLPYLLLALLAVGSLAARAYRIEVPCDRGCSAPRDATLMWDESYYANAARTIAGEEVPSGQPYRNTPPGRDPNAEHPQLAKLVMAAGVELIGNRPLGWRAGSVLAGTLALLLLFALVRAAGGGPWSALGASALMAADNLALVHGRIATLDIYALAFALGAALAYVRGRPVLAGAVLGVGLCTKLVSSYLLFVFGFLELGRWLLRRRNAEAAPARTATGTLAACIAVTGVSYLATLGLLGLAVAPYDPGARKDVGGPIAHTRHMLDTATSLTLRHGPTGAASYPWEWLTGRGEVDFLRIIEPRLVSGRVVSQRTTVAFRGAANPFLLLVALPALFMAAWVAWTRGTETDLLATAWFVGTFLPFCAQSLFEHRVMYIHYLLLVMPAIYLAAARLFSPRTVPAAATVGFAAAVAIGLVQLYPFRVL